ncbi:MAG: hypothetical protein EVJ48_02850 [Candidatus Acidulodesulfobacterium acidiphilum]|uniref:Uncharacterized protein n=1 Tax=Candidatus Acidulodesulfobacterium acidiphilum TaxID=2597224 RepID=A0A520XFA8_9DELT|nr:MAG: hypothetical protein EVJ48_02850 [Candidatus Acidulodesulfobacterium acidiphilum]
MIFSNTELNLQKRLLPNGSEEFFVKLQGESDISIPVSKEAVYVDDDGEDSLKGLAKLTLSISSVGRRIITLSPSGNDKNFAVLSSESDKSGDGDITVLSGGKKIMSEGNVSVIECDDTAECVIAFKKSGYKTGLFIIKDGQKIYLRNREVLGYYESAGEALPIYITPNLNGGCNISLN